MHKATIPVIYQWSDGQCDREVIDTNSFWMFCDWCQRYGNNPDAGDTRDLLYRWNIGIYQLTYINKMIKQTYIAEEEWAESMASVLIHMVASWEMAGINVADECSGNWHLELFNSREKLYAQLLEYIPAITRQLLYKAQHRHRRYNEEELKQYIPLMVATVAGLFRLGCHNYTLGEGLAFAIDKLQAKEFKTH